MRSSYSYIPRYALSSTIKSTVLALVDELCVKTVKMILTQCLLVCYLLQCCFGQTVIDVASGIYSTKRESNGLSLPTTSGTFEPIGALTTKIHLTKPYTVFVHYQLTGSSSDFWSKLKVNHFNAGSLVHSGNQLYKTATGFG